MRLLTELLIIFSVVACASKMPIKPDARMCVLDAPASQVICEVTNQGLVRYPLKNFDKAILFTADDWLDVQNYFDSLTEFANGCSYPCD